MRKVRCFGMSVVLCVCQQLRDGLMGRKTSFFSFLLRCDLRVGIMKMTTSFFFFFSSVIESGDDGDDAVFFKCLRERGGDDDNFFGACMSKSNRKETDDLVFGFFWCLYVRELQKGN